VTTVGLHWISIYIMFRRLTQIEQFESIEGIASDVRQIRIQNSLYENQTYECLLRLSGQPVQIRVNSSIFIEDGESIRVIGAFDGDGVFIAIVYHNLTAGVFGKSTSPDDLKQATARAKFAGAFFILIGGILYLFTHFILWLLPCILGLAFILVGWLFFVRAGKRIQAIEKLLYEGDPCKATKNRYGS
jgi:hypothetical protein